MNQPSFESASSGVAMSGHCEPTSVSDLRIFMSNAIHGVFLAIGLLVLLHLAKMIGLLTFEQVSGASTISPVAGTWAWIHENLRGSVYLFASVFIVFVVLVDQLRSMLEQGAPMANVSQLEFLADLCTSVFFGIGVIWTAIGMRSALLEGLGGLDSESAAAVGSFGILEKLVKGGILLALSTTIVGGIGGYLMKVYKSLRTGGLLRKRYAQEARASEQAVLDRLDALGQSLKELNQRLGSDMKSDTRIINPLGFQ